MLPDYCFLGVVVSEPEGGVLDAPELELPDEPIDPLPDVPPEAEPEVPPEVEPDALPLMPLDEPFGAELELLLAPPGAVDVAPGAELELLLELPGAGVAAPGAELELLLEAPGVRLAPGAVLEPELDEEVPGRVASLDFDGDASSRLQPVTASAIVTAAATSVSCVSLCMSFSFGVGGIKPNRQCVTRLVPVMVRQACHRIATRRAVDSPRSRGARLSARN